MRSGLYTLLGGLLIVSQLASAQKVGLVLSGGGSNGLAHIGVLRALEKDSIPIDYISGTSMGAIVGGLYACGYSPDQIEAILTNEDFLTEIQGENSDKRIYFFKAPAADASMANLRFAKNSAISTALPTGVIYPTGLDFNLMELCAGANAVSNENFDSLLVPFRCVASDITNKSSFLFEKGQVNKAIRASATYPFYYKPVLTDGRLLFDGGLYNNFPVDVMINEFNPDFIIGSNVSYNIDPPEIDDLISQVKSMLVFKTDYSLKGREGVLIEPQTEGSSFNYENPWLKIEEGQRAANQRMEEIKAKVFRRVPPEQRVAKRVSFNVRKPSILFDDFEVKGLNLAQAQFVKKNLQSKEKTQTVEQIREKFLLLIQDENLKYVYPGARFKENQRFTLDLNVEKEKDFLLKVGGNVSSKPINTGYVGFQYNSLRTNAISLEANSYFGKYYGSISAAARLRTGWQKPISIELSSCFNRWDYFKSKSSFYEDVRPSYILFQEEYLGFQAATPFGLKGKLSFDFKVFQQQGNYYLSENFTASDTSDLTRFEGFTTALVLERNTLNRKQWASSGTRVLLKARLYSGDETSMPGSTSIIKTETQQKQQWLSLFASHTNYFKTIKRVRLGYLLEGVYNTQYYFTNFKANLIFNSAFQPIPETKTLFLTSFRANKYLAGGFVGVIELAKNLDHRIGAYIFQPINTFQQTDQQGTRLGRLLGSRYNILTTSLVYHSPMGPVSLSLNYYEKQQQSFSLIFNFGYILFNRGVAD